MPTDKPRVTITMAPEQLRRIDDYRFENKMKNQTQAILSLIEAGLDDLEREIEKSPSATNGALGGKHISLEKSNDLLVALGLIKEGQQLSDDDLAFLTHIVGLLDAWFSKDQ